jgi:murein DD-endopeptidase MepM/ murein hydrolase activator NlpD
VVLLIVCLAGCGGRKSQHVPKTYHVVQAGETLSRIGEAYGVPYETIARANHITDPSRIEIGQRLLIPDAKRAGKVVALENGGAPSRRGEGKPKDAPLLRWPVVNGEVTSGFGPRGGGFHDGIDIGAPIGAPIYAAAAGRVAYCSSLPGYGNVIILRHGGGYATVYAHNRQHVVKEGDPVKEGQIIARVGESGRTTGPNLHFEVRRENVAHNPLYFLPRAAHAAGETKGGGG